MSINDLFISKECLSVDPWDMEPLDRERWVNCAYLKSRNSSIAFAIILVFTMLIMGYYYYIQNETSSLIMLGVIGTIIGGFTIYGMLTASYYAGMRFDRYKQVLDAELKITNDPQKARANVIDREYKDRVLSLQRGMINASRLDNYRRTQHISYNV